MPVIVARFHTPPQEEDSPPKLIREYLTEHGTYTQDITKAEKLNIHDYVAVTEAVRSLTTSSGFYHFARIVNLRELDPKAKQPFLLDLED